MNQRLRRFFGLVLTALLMSNTVTSTAYSGVMPEITRVIYLEGQKERTLMVANTNAYPVLVQVWVNHGEDSLDPQQALAPLVAVPPVFKMQPGALQGIRLIFNGDQLPTDRETVFWLNIYEAPPTLSHAMAPAPRLAVAMNTQMKIFYRPHSVPPVGRDLASKLSFYLRQTGSQRCVLVRNRTPYHASFSSLRVVQGTQTMTAIQRHDMMTLPLSERCYPLPSAPLIETAQSRMSFTLLDDDGHFLDGTSPLDMMTDQ